MLAIGFDFFPALKMKNKRAKHNTASTMIFDSYTIAETNSKKGKRKIENIPQKKPPAIVRKIAFRAFPFKTILCPGSTERKDPWLGIPRKIDGKNSAKECITAKPTANPMNSFPKKLFNARNERIKLMWIPGKKPVKIPAQIPINKYSKISCNKINPFHNQLRFSFMDRNRTN